MQLSKKTKEINTQKPKAPLSSRYRDVIVQKELNIARLKQIVLVEARIKDPDEADPPFRPQTSATLKRKKSSFSQFLQDEAVYKSRKQRNL